MAQKMVTRTITSTKVECMVVIPSKAEITNLTLTVSGDYTGNADKLAKAIKKEHETDDFKVVNIGKPVLYEAVYGMSEVDFLKHAIKVERKPNGTVTEVCTTDDTASEN